MKVNKLILIVFAIAIFFGITITAEASLTGPLSASDFTGYTFGATYGPPPAVGFPDGPTSVQSDIDVNLTYGPDPGQENVDTLLFVLSYDPSLSSFVSGTISFSSSIDPVSFGPTDFFTNAQTGFPDNIEGIANGEVGGVKFPDAVHAGVTSPFSLGSEGDLFDIITITSPIFPLRVDIFSISNGTIIGNTPNSHALAVVPEPASMLLLGGGLIGFAVAGRKKFFKKK